MLCLRSFGLSYSDFEQRREANASSKPAGAAPCPDGTVHVDEMYIATTIIPCTGNLWCKTTWPSAQASTTICDVVI